MVKKIKFPLEMDNGIMVRTLEELKENFSLEMVISHFSTGKLLNWLNDRYYEEEAAQIADLSSSSTDFKQKLCGILNVEYTIDNEINIEMIEKRNMKISKLKQYTEDETIIKNVDKVAFNQEELADLLDYDVTPIYLCGGKFAIPLGKENIRYIGISKPIIDIKSKTDIDLDKNNIVIEDCIIKSEFPISLISTNSKEIICEGKIEYKNKFDNLINKSTWKASIKNRRIYEDELDERGKDFLNVLGKTDSNGKRYIERKSLYRCSADGSDEQLITTDDSNVSDYCVYENTIFYSLGASKLSVYKIDIDGSNKENLNIEFEVSASIFRSNDEEKNLLCNKNWLILFDKNGLYKSRHDGKYKEKIPALYSSVKNAKIVDNYLFYTNGRNDYLYRVDLESNSIIQIDYNVRKIDVDEKNLYYLKWENIGWGEPQYCFYKGNLEGNDKVLLKHQYPQDTVIRLKHRDGVLYYYTKRVRALMIDSSAPEIENKIIIER